MAEEGAVCGNCNKAAAQALRCGVCKKATYCTPACQREDWKFHKRLCKKAEPKEEPKQAKVMEDPMEAAEMRRQMEELTKDKDPALAHQVQSMMAGMMGVEAPAPPPKPAEPPPPCQNCAKECVKPLRCGKCKAVTYCSQKCQKDDWQFHKRNCKQAPPATTAPGTAAAGEAAGEAAAGAGSAVRAAAEAAEIKKPAARPAAENETMVVDEDVGKWYKHRDWKPDKAAQEFAPQKLERPAADAAPKGGGSAWNAAGTWEEKNMMPWWRERLDGLKGVAGDVEDSFLQLESVADLKGQASIVRSRGQPKFMYDITFGMPFLGMRSCKACARSVGSRCSNCVRFAGKLEIVEFSWDCEGSVEFQVKHSVPGGPDHVKKADSSECRREAEAQLQPVVRTFLNTAVADYKRTVAGAAEAQKWASQLPPTSPARVGTAAAAPSEQPEQ